MKIIALDIATKTGWCVGEMGSIPVHGVEDFSIDKKKGDTDGTRFIKFHIWLRKLIKGQLPDIVYYEDVKFFRGGGATLVWCGLLSQVQMICEAEGVECSGLYDLQNIKKYARGVGDKMEKDKLIFEATEQGYKKSKALTFATAQQLGFKPISDDDADAICLWHCAVGEL